MISLNVLFLINIISDRAFSLRVSIQWSLIYASVITGIRALLSESCWRGKERSVLVRGAGHHDNSGAGRGPEK